MESEKVKEIKKALEHCGEEVTCQGCPEYNNEPVIDWFKCKKNLSQKTITLINELESENEKLKQHKRELQGGQQDLTRRIAELEKENAKLLDSVETVQSNRCVYKCVLTKEHLTKFAERLKERSYDMFKGSDIITIEDIDETLKEFICDYNQ